MGEVNDTSDIFSHALHATHSQRILSISQLYRRDYFILRATSQSDTDPLITSIPLTSLRFFHFAISPHFRMTLHVLLEVRGCLQLLVTGLAGVDFDARQLFTMLIQVQRELALKNKLISALGTDQILQGGGEHRIRQ